MTKPLRLLRLPAVSDRVSLKRSAIYARIDAGDFPRPVVLSSCAVAWREDEIEAWIDALPRSADAASA